MQCDVCPGDAVRCCPRAGRLKVEQRKRPPVPQVRRFEDDTGDGGSSKTRPPGGVQWAR